ncbi:PHA/PHB synthase family protein [Salaquimonas pukyongi]|uniref:PHA/PHB synthase family protein n=1 Tax=Salaquimonas pukyongi TaxID=2712698 RepID=UPI00096BC14F|nr:class I poly(R)-hydroxyalkanoic acid synthase [Salaquimonas pukyongi]
MEKSAYDPQVLKGNLDKLEDLTVRLVNAIANRRESDPAMQGPGYNLYAKAAAAYYAEMMARPEKIIEQQVQFWRKSLENFSNAQTLLNEDEQKEPAAKKGPGDRRFKNPLWASNPYFNFVRDQYLLSTEMIDQTVTGLEEIDDKEKRRVQFFARQLVDLFSPSNFFGTNPDALEKALETNGQSLVDGLANLVRDLEANDGELSVTLADPKAFEVGGNIATSPGDVVFRNRMFELIQYAPATKEVHKTPLVIFPPWINKFYILDLKEKNSFIRYAVSQGYTVFVVSWVNPDENYRDVGIDTYVEEGALAAINAVQDITGSKKVNAIGYCIGGTLLTITLALMAANGDDRVKSATFFTTLTDFSEAGDLGVFIDEDFLTAIETEVDKRGFLDSFYMSKTFSYLRANDLVYGPAVRSYMMGEAPPAFDLLFWNGDSTNLPARMAKEYLRHLYAENKLIKGEFEVNGTVIDMSKIDLPIYVVATESDHIAPWKSSFTGLSTTSGEKQMVLSESGHIAGIVNPPEAGKYGYWLNDEACTDPDEWHKAAEHHDGSWWPHWSNWLSERSGKMVEARQPGSKSHPSLAPAPGTYVVAERKK